MNRLQKFDGWRLLKKDPVPWISGITLSKVFLSLEPSYILFSLQIPPFNLKSQLINATASNYAFSIETLPDSIIESKNNIKIFFLNFK